MFTKSKLAQQGNKETKYDARKFNKARKGNHTTKTQTKMNKK